MHKMTFVIITIPEKIWLYTTWFNGSTVIFVEASRLVAKVLPNIWYSNNIYWWFWIIDIFLDVICMVFMIIICENQTPRTYIFCWGLKFFSYFQSYSCSNDRKKNNLRTLIIIPVAELSSLNGIPSVSHEKGLSLEWLDFLVKKLHAK